MKGQISAEMLILLAVVLAIVALAAYYLTEVGKEGGEAVGNRTSDILHKTTLRGCHEECSEDGECISGKCEGGYCSCD